MYEKNCFTNLKTNVEKSLSNVNDEDKILIDYCMFMLNWLFDGDEVDINGLNISKDLLRLYE